MNIKERFSSDSNSFLNLAIAYADKKDYLKAKEYFRKAIELEPKIPENYFCFGSYLLEFVMKERIWRFGLTSENIEELKEAEALLTKAIEILRNSEKRVQLEDAYINRSSIRVVLDNYVGAFEDINAAISINPNSADAYSNRARLNSLNKDLDGAIRDFETALEKGGRKDDLFPMLISCFVERPDSKPDEAIAIIKKFYSDNEIESNIFPGILYVECLINKMNYEEADRILGMLYNKFGRDSKILLTEADLRKKNGDLPGFESLSEEARQSAVGKDKGIAEVHLAKHYKNTGLYDKAIPLFESIVSKTLFDDILRDYLICLYKGKENRSKNLQICLEICRNLKESGQKIPFTLELEAAIYVEMDDLSNAAAIYSELIKLEPNNYHHKLNYAQMLIDIGKQKEEGEKLLMDIKEHINDRDSLIKLSSSFFRVQNEDEAIKQMFKALELDSSNPQTQLLYINIFLYRKEKKSNFLDSEIVQEDFLVKIKNNGQVQEYLMTNKPQASIAKFELYKDSGLGKMLYGKKVGEIITTKNKFAANDTIEILEIKNKYVKAFQHILETFNISFPDNKALFKIEAKPENINEILNQASERSTQIMQMYQSKNITIGALSAFSQRSLFVTWGALIQKRAQLYCASGSSTEQRMEQDTILASSSVLLEPIILFTLGQLDILHVPAQYFKNVYVAKASMDELDMEIMELRKSEDSGLTTIYHLDGKSYREEISSENIKLKIKFLERIRNCESFKVIGLETPLTDETKEREKIFGIPYAYSIQICNEKTISLFCDDLLFRQLINNEYKIKSFSIQNFLAIALIKGLLKENEFFEKILELVRMNYKYISISAPLLFYFCKKSNFQHNNEDDFYKLISVLNSKETSIESLIAVLSDFLKLIALVPISKQVKNSYLELILKILEPRGDLKEILTVLKVALFKKLGIENPFLPEINEKLNK